MEPESREQANDASGDTFGSDSQSVMLRNRSVRERVDAASGTCEESLAVKAQQKLTGDSKGFNIARTHQWLARGESQDPLWGRSLRHVAFYR
jgi:hypothetical protein